MSNFKLIFLGIFIAGAIFGILVFAGIINIGGGSTTVAAPKGNVTVWGTFENRAMQTYVADFNLQSKDIKLTYVAKDPATFDTSLIEAMATNSAPDLVLLPDNLIWRFKDKLSHIPYASLPAQTFQTTFTSGSNIFQVSDGTLAVPWASDPLVMYYNRDLLDSISVVNPPKTWDAFTKTIPLLAKKQPDLTLTQMGTAMGAYANIAHAKDMLALLFIESGSPFITAGDSNLLNVHFGGIASGNENKAATAATNFYMSFSDPLKEAYSWNSGEPLDRNAFIKSDLAYYFGTASELPVIRAQNPNLNFGIALPPQSPSGAAVTTGHVYGFAIPKNSKTTDLAFAATKILSSAGSEASLVTKLGTTLTLVPVRRDVLAQKPVSDAYLGFLFDAALVQKAWLDPNPVASDQIFATFIKDISSSTLTADQALTKASAQLSTLSGTI